MRVLLIVLTMWVSGGGLAPVSAAPLQRARDRAPDVARPRAQAPVRPPRAGNAAPVRPPIADALEGVLANGLRRRLRLNENQLNRIRPALRESLQRRNRLAQENIRARNELARAAQEGRSEEEIDGLIRQYEETNRQLGEAREEFFRAADPELTPAQRALLRSEFPNMEQQIRNLIEQSRGPNP
jgi:hypothetical protein